MRGVAVKSSGVHGLGVFATRDIMAGESIGSFGGRRITMPRAILDVLRHRIQIDDPLQISAHGYLDLDALSIRINHSCDPNTAVRGECELFALKNIANGSEITFDYSMTALPSFYSWLWEMPCNCGAANCRKSIGDLASVPAERIAAYRARGALQDYILAGLRRPQFWAGFGRLMKPVKRLTVSAWNGFDRWGERIAQRFAKPEPPRPAPPDHSFVLPGGRTGVLLIHGLSGTPVEMREVAEALAAQGYTVSCPQLAGHCGIFEDLRDSRWQEWAHSAETALADLAMRCDTIIVGGLSAGAVISLHLAAIAPDRVQGVMLLAPTLWLNGWVVPPHAYLFRLVTTKWFANVFDHPDLPPHGVKDPDIRAHIAAAIHSGDPSKAGLPVTPGGSVLEHRWMVNSVRRRMKLVTQPVLLVHPREDDYADINNITYLLRHLPSDVETLTLSDSYHIITVDRQKHLVFEHAIRFVERVAQRSETDRRLQTIAGSDPQPSTQVN